MSFTGVIPYDIINIEGYLEDYRSSSAIKGPCLNPNNIRNKWNYIVLIGLHGWK